MAAFEEHTLLYLDISTASEYWAFVISEIITYCRLFYDLNAYSSHKLLLGTRETVISLTDESDQSLSKVLERLRVFKKENIAEHELEPDRSLNIMLMNIFQYIKDTGTIDRIGCSIKLIYISIIEHDLESLSDNIYQSILNIKLNIGYYFKSPLVMLTLLSLAEDEMLLLDDVPLHQTSFIMLSEQVFSSFSHMKQALFTLFYSREFNKYGKLKIKDIPMKKKSENEKKSYEVDCSMTRSFLDCHNTLQESGDLTLFYGKRSDHTPIMKIQCSHIITPLNIYDPPSQVITQALLSGSPYLFSTLTGGSHHGDSQPTHYIQLKNGVFTLFCCGTPAGPKESKKSSIMKHLKEKYSNLSFNSSLESSYKLFFPILDRNNQTLFSSLSEEIHLNSLIVRKDFDRTTLLLDIFTKYFHIRETCSILFKLLDSDSSGSYLQFVKSYQELLVMKEFSNAQLLTFEKALATMCSYSINSNISSDLEPKGRIAFCEDLFNEILHWIRLTSDITYYHRQLLMTTVNTIHRYKEIAKNTIQQRDTTNEVKEEVKLLPKEILNIPKGVPSGNLSGAAVVDVYEELLDVTNINVKSSSVFVPLTPYLNIVHAKLSSRPDIVIKKNSLLHHYWNGFMSIEKKRKYGFDSKL